MTLSFTSEMRRQLGFADQSFEIGSWWCVPHEAVVHHERGAYAGRPYAKKSKPGDGRRVILGSTFGPNAILYPRSTSVKTSFEHFRHPHADFDGRCAVTCRGWINFSQPVSVDVDLLTIEYFSCEEPDGSDVLARIAELQAP